MWVNGWSCGPAAVQALRGGISLWLNKLRSQDCVHSSLPYHTAPMCAQETCGQTSCMAEVLASILCQSLTTHAAVQHVPLILRAAPAPS